MCLFQIIWQTKTLVLLFFALSRHKQPLLSRTCIGGSLQRRGLHVSGCCVHKGRNVL